MKRLLWLVLIVAVGLPTLAACDMSDPAVAAPASFQTLARHTPVGTGATEPFFLNFKPGGDTARNWEQFRHRLEDTTMGQDLMQNLLGQFKVEILNLEDVIDGPAVSAYWQGITYVILEVTDEAAAREAMIANLGDASAWQQTDFEGRTIYHGQFREGNGSSTYLAWTTAGGLLFMTHRTVDSAGYGAMVVSPLKDLLQVTEEESVAALPAWQKLEDRLPRSTVGVSFIWFGPENQSPPGDAASPFEALTRSLQGAALALVPEEDGLRINIDGIFDPEAGSVSQLQALFDMPPIDADVWGGLPQGTAIALAGYDAPALLPWLQEMFGLQLDAFQQAATPLGLDIEDDLLGEDGPLTGALAVGFSPPLPDQPTLDLLPALQILVVLPDAGLAEGEALQQAMEARGAVFGPQEVEGVEVQAQVGTAASGYAIAYADHDGVLYLGTSPQVVGQGITAAELEEDAAFRAVRAALPNEPTTAAYVQTAALAELLKANTTAGQYTEQPEYRLLELFESIGLGLRFEPERIYGVLYLRLGE
jgi:hypothetical protein